MKKSACLLALLLGCVCAARAQVDIEVVLDQEQFLVKESLPVKVRIHNHSGQILRFGTNAWLSFLVEAQTGPGVEKLGDPPTDHNFNVESSIVATQRADLAPYFNLTRIGHYTLTATVKVDDWNVEITSPKVGFDIVSGVKLWEEEFGVPSTSPDDHAPPEIRKYILQRAAYLKHLRLYLRVTDDSESTVYGVLPLGTVTSFTEPMTRLDPKNNLHLLYEESARTYAYREISPDGDLIVRQQYGYTDGPPHLKQEKDGTIVVVGAERRLTMDDIPPDTTPTADTSTNSLPVVPSVHP